MPEDVEARVRAANLMWRASVALRAERGRELDAVARAGDVGPKLRWKLARLGQLDAEIHEYSRGRLRRRKAIAYRRTKRAVARLSALR